MTVEQAIVERLLSNGPVAALVGTRVRQLKLRQAETLPAIRVQLIDQPETYHLRGGSVSKRSRVQTDVFTAEVTGADPYAQAVSVADAVDAALSGQVFETADSPPSLKVTGCFRQDRRPSYEAEELRQVRMMQDYIVWTRELT